MLRILRIDILLLCSSLALCAGFVQAQSEGMEDPVTQLDAAAEAQAQAQAQAQAKKAAAQAKPAPEKELPETRDA